MDMPKIQQSRRCHPVALLGLGLVAVVAGGCGGSDDGAAPGRVNPVSGRIVLENGKPLSGGRVVFVSSDGRAPSGVIGHDGTFTLSSGDGAEGAPAGEYKVRIEPPGLAGRARSRPPIASRYLDEDGSGLRATVQDGENRLEPFQLSAREVVSRAGGRDRD